VTALAVALVLCCAMVCGTYLATRRYDVREVEAQAAMRDVSALAARLDGYERQYSLDASRIEALTSDVHSLRAALALRQV
jgi:hypothetical protein